MKQSQQPFVSLQQRWQSRRRCGAARRAVLGDGAKWIWNLADEHFPDAVQIIDRFHAKHKLSDVTKSIYGPASDLGKEWRHQRHDELDAGDLEAVSDTIALVRQHLWSASETYCMSPAEPDILKISRPMFDRIIDSLCYAA